MRLTSLSVKHVRTHDDYSIILHPTVTVITGMNGTGKTSLIEAIYIALQGSSFKGSDNEVLRFNEPWYRIDIVSDEQQIRTVKYNPSLSSGKKQFEIDNKTNYRLTHANKYPVVLFDPDELRLIHGSPARRRQFIDRFISQFDPEYAVALRRYERALKQRNMLLKNIAGRDDIFVWDVLLSKHGAYIVRRRIEVIDQLNEKLGELYGGIASSNDLVGLEYSTRYNESAEQKLLNELHLSVDRDKALGVTTVGPHRHDILFTLNSSLAATVASRGEVRTIILSLKFLEVALLEEMTGKRPVILLDDVFSELDESRQTALMKRFSEYQTIITSVNSPGNEYLVHRLAS